MTEIKKIGANFNSQIKATLKESDCEEGFRAYYDMGRLYLFKRVGNKIFRLDNSKNSPNSQRILEQYQLEITDPYNLIPNHKELLKVNNELISLDESEKYIEDLDVIFSMNDEVLKHH